MAIKHKISGDQGSGRTTRANALKKKFEAKGQKAIIIHDCTPAGLAQLHKSQQYKHIIIDVI